MANKTKTVTEKIASAVDNLLHPSAIPADAPVTSTDASVQPETGSNHEAAAKILEKELNSSGPKPALSEKLSKKQSSDLQKHPKFAKFKEVKGEKST